MSKKSSTDEKKQIAEIYSSGKSVAFICQEFNLPKSAVYCWIKKYSEIQRPSGETTDATKIYLLEKRIKRQFHKNKLKQRFTQEEPIRVWVSDITYLYANYVFDDGISNYKWGCLVRRHPRLFSFIGCYLVTIFLIKVV